MQKSGTARKRIGIRSLVIMVLVGLAVAFILARLTNREVETWNLNKTIGWGK